MESATRREIKRILEPGSRKDLEEQQVPWTPSGGDGSDVDDEVDSEEIGSEEIETDVDEIIYDVFDEGGLEELIRAIDPDNYTDFESFFFDNSEVEEAIVEWIADKTEENPDWAENLRKWKSSKEGE